MCFLEKHRIRFLCCGLILATQVFNMLHNMIGVGTLAYPSTFKNTGILPGAFITIICSIMVFYSADLIIKNMLKLRRWTFLGISKELYPPIISNIIELLKSVTTFLSSTAFAISALDNLPCIVLLIKNNNGQEIINGRLLNALIIFVFLSLIVLYENIESLKFISSAGLFIFIVAVLMLNGYLIIDHSTSNEYLLYKEYTDDYFLSVSTNCLAFAIHYNATRYYYEIAREELKIILRERENNLTNIETNVLIILENEELNDIDYMNAMSRLENIEIHERSLRIMKFTLFITFLISCILYLIFGISGYIKLGNDVEGDVLNSINDPSPLIKCLKILVGLSVMTAIPLTIHPAVNGIMNVLKEMSEMRCNIYGNNNNRDANVYHNIANNINENPNFIRENFKIIRKIIAILMTFGVMYTAAVIEDLDELLEFKGCTLIVMFVLLIPAIDRLTIIWYYDRIDKEYLWRSILILLLGITIMVAGLASWIHKYSKKENEIKLSNYTNFTSKDCKFGIWKYYFNNNNNLN
jgi:amino acid permease